MIYLLWRPDRPNFDYDSYDSKVVVAPSEQRAREIANGEVGDEGRIWDDPTKVSCRVLDPDGKPGEILAASTRVNL